MTDILKAMKRAKTIERCANLRPENMSLGSKILCTPINELTSLTAVTGINDLVKMMMSFPVIDGMKAQDTQIIRALENYPLLEDITSIANLISLGAVGIGGKMEFDFGVLYGDTIKMKKHCLVNGCSEEEVMKFIAEHPIPSITLLLMPETYVAFYAQSLAKIVKNFGGLCGGALIRFADEMIVQIPLASFVSLLGLSPIATASINAKIITVTASIVSAALSNLYDEQEGALSETLQSLLEIGVDVLSLQVTYDALSQALGDLHAMQDAMLQESLAGVCDNTFLN